MKRFALACLLMLCVLLPFSAQADPTVIIEPDAAGVPEQVVAQLVADYPDAGVITITSHHTANETAQAPVEVNTFQPAQHAVIMLTVLAAGLGLLCIRSRMRTA